MHLVSAGGACSEGWARRRRRRPRRRCGAGLRSVAAGPWGAAGQQALAGRRGKHGEGSNRHGARGEDREIAVPAGTQAEALDGSRARSGRGRSAGCGCSRRARGSWEQAVCELDATGAAICRERDAWRRGVDRAAAEAAGGRWADRIAECGQVLAAEPLDASGAEGGRLPVHDHLPELGDDRKRGPSGGAGRHPRFDRRGSRRGRSRTRVPGPHRALHDAGPPC